MTAVETLGQIKLLERGAWAIAARPYVMMRLRRIFSRSRQKEGAILLEHTPEIARELEWVLDRWPLTISDKDLATLRAAAQAHRDREAAVAEILNGSGSLTGDTWRTPSVKPRSYQLQASDLALTTGRLLVGDALGLGKTFTGLLTFRHPESTPGLVVAPTHLVKQWEEQCARFLPMLRTHVIRKTTPYDPSQTRFMRGHDPDLLITTYTKLDGWRNHLAGKVRTVVFDEMHELRRPGTLKYEAAEEIAAGAAYRIGLTATPVFNYGGDIWNIIRLLDPDALGSLSEFVAEWGHYGSNGKIIVSDPGALGAYLRDSGLFLRRTRADVGRELPKVQRIVESIECDRDALDRVQSEIRTLAHTILESQDHREVFLAKGELDWRMREATGVAKAPHVAAFVRQLLDTERKVVVFLWHREAYNQIGDLLADYNPVLYTGSESPVQKDRAATKFVTDDTCRVMLMSLRSGAGLDGLQAVCSTCVFGELDWSPSQHDQGIGRFNRDGQAEPVTAYFLLADSGSDPIVAEALGIKRQQADGIHDPNAELFVPTAQEHAEADDRFMRLANEALRGGKR